MKVAYYGYLPKSTEAMGGAEVKTKTVLRALRDSTAVDLLKAYDTSNWRKRFPVVIKDIIVGCLWADDVILVSGTTTFIKFLTLVLLLCLISKAKIHFIPVGDCEPQFFNNKNDRNNFSKIDGAYVQTELSAKKLEQLGFNNIYVMHNFKYLPAYLDKYDCSNGFWFVYFSRVSEVKGIFETITAFEHLKGRGCNCYLDIYGKVDDDIKQQFEDRIKQDKEFISYKGIASPDKSSGILKDYYMMVFPTKFSGEGFPGVLLDAFAAGIPVLSSRFRFYDDLLSDKIDSLAFEFNDYEDLESKLIYACEHPEEICSMRVNSAKNYKRYSPENEIAVIIDRLNN